MTEDQGPKLAEGGLSLPLFMLTYLPITVAALFQKVEWKPIRHKSVAQLDQAA